MARLFIPACGDRITLSQHWSFNLILESRNCKFAESLGIDLKQFKSTGYSWRGPLDSVLVVLQPDTILECDRVYIRAMAKRADTVDDSYDSLTWKVVVNGKPSSKQRFWVKLTDCYTLEFDTNSISRYMDRK
jgi:hypothetical protein